jgi:UDP-N-acetylmuramyl tripeptide synthase
MKIESVRAITGPNVYSHKPVMVARFDLEKLKDGRSHEAAGFNNRLLETFPGLREHCCARGRGGFVERLEEGTYFNHVIEHIVVEMLTQAGLEQRVVKLCGVDVRDSSHAVIETTVVEAARFLLPVAAEILEAILEEKTYAYKEKILEAKIIATDAEFAPSVRAIVEAAEKRGIPWTRARENNLIQLGYGKNLHFVQANTTDQTSGRPAEPSSDKDETERREPRDVGAAAIETLYPKGAPSRIPIVAVTGTNGKTTVTRMIAHILLKTGLNVGAATTNGILFNGESIFIGDTTGPVSAKKVLGDKAVDIAVLETARGGILRRGLGWDWADIGVVTNIREDHIGQDGIESVADLVNIKALIAERVRENGTLVLNADDAESANLINRPAVRQIKKKIVYFALAEENPFIKKHSETGETVYFARGNWICEKSGAGQVRQIVETTAIPVTMNGTADFQIENAMAAVAVARALGLSPEKISDALGEFRGETHNPGRNNLYRVGAGYALVDYGHNTDGFAAVCRMASRWTGKTVTAIISLPGDRDNRIIEEAAQVAARGFDRVIVTEEVNPRGRAPGEMAKLLCDAVKRENPDGRCEIVPDEIEAFSKALAEMREHEVVVMFYRQLNLILEILAENRAVPVSSFDESVGIS